ncbi:hypothetical protein LZQ00_11455 [Sphingobacterium sp. SRCM116780]|uniref:putative zinc-binding metallopeptidase n=1 Tax=Sphingobacterium sp. SRCM116780 TaxID=2907623 RepID=UPI001F1EACE1|nr:putative zinc-binding metallopeptidase [Sphingobacterium sp. SRCM116780]UIR54894.1 hypothetical protein LZQ00_11455 [Sphingobacterium sp. SRCM116780]
MKNFKTIYKTVLCIGLTIILGFVACKKTEEPLTPSDIPEPGYQLAQGNNSYDIRIKAYFERWGTYILYQFTPAQINWKVTGYDTYYKSAPAEEAFVDQQLDLLNETFFQYYADSTLQKYLPVKLFLCSSLQAGTSSQQIDAYLLTMSNGRFGGYQSFAVNGGNSAISNINKVTYRANVNFSFLKMMDLESKMTKSPVFLSLTDYVNAIVGTTVADRYKRGFLASTSGFSDQAQDWQSYIQAITAYPYSYLTDVNTDANDATAKGILSPVKDVNGLIRKKYDALVKHYKDQYGIDIQRIGNGM